MRRVKAMIENLIETLPDQREPVLHQELRILASSAKRGFAESDDQKLADTSDLQGLGGSNTEKQKTQSAAAHIGWIAVIDKKPNAACLVTFWR